MIARIFSMLCFWCFSIFYCNQAFPQCSGFKVNAGPDQFTCDPSIPIQLMGSVQGNYKQFYWTPAFGLSNASIADPWVTKNTSGIYKFKLTSEGPSSTNLIINGDFESGNTGFSSNYIHFSLPGWIPLEAYAIDVNPAPYYVPEYAACSDHTSGSGNMMILNGATIPGLDFWCQTVTVKPNTDYYFEVYFASIYPTAPSTIRISFNAQVLQTVQLPSTTCDWIAYETTWNSGVSSSLNICMQDMDLIGWGNDFAVDDISLFEKCKDEDEVIVEIVDLITALDIPNKPRCSSQVFDLDGTGSSTGPNIRYEWSTDIGKIISRNGLHAQGQGTGTYTLKIIYKNATVECEKEVSIDYVAPDELSGVLNAVGVANCRLDSITLEATVKTGSGDYSYQWSPIQQIIQGQATPKVIVIEGGKYLLLVTDNKTACELSLNYEIILDTLRPKAIIQGDTSIDCSKNLITLNSLIKDTFKYNFIWTTPDKLVIKDSIKISSNLSGNYTLRLTSKLNFCTDSITWSIAADTAKPQFSLGSDLMIDCKNNGVNIAPIETSQNIPFGYYWQLPSGILFKETQLLDKSSTQAGPVILKIINERNGCSNSDTLEIKDIRKLPIIDAGTNELLTCKINSISLNASGPFKSNFEINWSTLSGNIVSGQNSYSPIINKSGWYFLSVTDTINSCASFDSVYIDENKIAPIALLGPDMTFKCSDTLVSINATGSSQGSNIKYVWFSPNGNIRTGQGTFSILVSSPGNYGIAVIDTFNGCSDTAFINVQRDQNNPVVTISVPDTLSCKVKEIILSANALSQSGNSLRYNWTGSGATVQNANTLNPTITSPGIYILKVQDIVNGCSTQIETIVYLDSIPPIAIAGNDQSWYCKTSELELDGSRSSGQHAIIYKWSSTNGMIKGIADQAKIKIQSPGTYFLQVEDIHSGCIAMDTIFVESDQKIPVAFIQNPGTLNCRQTTIQLLGWGSSVGNRIHYLWQSNDGHIISDPHQLNIKIDRAGTYILEVRDTINNCSSNDFELVIEDKVKPIILINTPELLTCNRQMIDLTATVKNTGPNYSILWNTTDGRIVSTKNALTATINLKGTYFINIVNQDNGCEISDSVQVDQNSNFPTGLISDIIQLKCPTESGSFQIKQIIGGEQPFSYILDSQNRSGTIYSGLNAGPHTLKIIDRNGCELNYNFNIQTTNALLIDLIPFAEINEGENYSIKPIYSIPDDSIQSVNWMPTEHLSCSDCLYPQVIKLSATTTFTVNYSNKNGCTASAQITIRIIKKGFWIPNVFSPNGDGINDWFYPTASENSYKEIKSMSIYSRWGDRIFYKEHINPNTPQEAWDGAINGIKSNPGVYFYLIEIIWNSGEVQNFYGDLTLIR